mmetsp:Transcript_13132/g.25361  ORF Transcript_13132/g.25361 Transcript_13132/m.25361 type:complete len:242 (+) Transcript_13132:276-1001(+)
MQLEVPTLRKVFGCSSAQGGQTPRKGTTDPEYCMKHAIVSLLGKETPTCGKLKECHTSAPHIHSWARALAKDGLWGPVRATISRPHIRGPLLLRGIKGTSKIAQFDGTFVKGHEQVVRFDIIVNHAYPPQSAKCKQQISAIGPHCRQGESLTSSASLQPKVHTAPLQLKDESQVTLMFESLRSCQVEETVCTSRILLRGLYAEPSHQFDFHLRGLAQHRVGTNKFHSVFLTLLDVLTAEDG